MSPAHRSLNLVFLGPPASGKGTQAKVLSERYEIPHVATGLMLRSEVERSTALGSQVKESIDRGALVPDELIRGLILQRLLREDCARGFLLDGYPRSIEQAGILDDMLAELGRAIERVILLRVPDDEIIRRQRERGQRRPDEQDAVVTERLRTYREKESELRELYQRRGLLVEVDGRQSQEMVTEAVMHGVGAAVSA